MLLTEMIKPNENETGFTLLITNFSNENARTCRGHVEKDVDGSKSKGFCYVELKMYEPRMYEWLLTSYLAQILNTDD